MKGLDQNKLYRSKKTVLIRVNCPDIVLTNLLLRFQVVTDTSSLRYSHKY